MDMWSLGVTFYSFVFGHVPFEDSNRLALYQKVLTQPLVFPERCEPSRRSDHSNIRFIMVNVGFLGVAVRW